MLKRLHIKNYAIIEEIEVDFSNGLNVITGETGAGKSILIGALNLILGQRADSSVLLDIEKKCIVEGVFAMGKDSQLGLLLNNYEIELGLDIFLRREISSNGKSRSFINDTPVNLSQLKEVSLLLVDLHQQFDSLEINSQAFQIQVLDTIAGNTTLSNELSENYNQYLQLRNEFNHTKELENTAQKEQDYLLFLFKELEDLNLKENELESIESNLKILNDAESIKIQLSSIYQVIKEGEHPLFQQVKSLANKLKIANADAIGIEPIKERLLSVSIELQDIAEELEKIESSIQYDSASINALNERLSIGFKLLKKHQFQSTAELLSLQHQIEEKLDGYKRMISTIAELENKMNEAYEKCLSLARIISKNRISVIDIFTNEINALLLKVGMPNAKLQVRMEVSPLTKDGIDNLDFLFDANNKNKFESLGKVASGGELSRLMLCIKSLVAQKLAMPTMIFDEIDSGISGEAAKQVAGIMRSLSQNHQIITITHQPQIAAKADAHYYVYKNKKQLGVQTEIRLLAFEERVMEIAKMLSGDKPTTTALEIAKEMIHN